jgi:hypothetical protein
MEAGRVANANHIEDCTFFRSSMLSECRVHVQAGDLNLGAVTKCLASLSLSRLLYIAPSCIKQQLFLALHFIHVYFSAFITSYSNPERQSLYLSRHQ